MRLARILAFLLALAIVGVSLYLLRAMPFAWLQLVPANVGMLMSLWFWRNAPKRKKARKRAALASTLVVPLVAASGVLSYLLAPLVVWPAFLALALLGSIVAVVALLRVERKEAHVWAGYYSDVT